MYATRRRPHPPPRYGRPGYYYNYPHVVYVHSPAPQREAHMYPTIVVQQPNGGNVITDSHLVEIPPDIYPGESFRVQVGGFEYLLTCPDSIPGGQGGRFILAVRGGHTNQIPKNAVQATIPAANRYQQPITYSSVPVTGAAGGGGGAVYGAPVPCAPVVPDNNSSHGSVFMSPEQQKQQQQQQPQYATASAMAATPANGGNNSNNPFAGAVPGVSNYPPQQQQYQQYQQPVMATATVVGADGSYAPMATGVAVSAEAVEVNVKESEGAGGWYSAAAAASSGRGAAEKKCSLCTFDNKPTASTCEMCNTAL